MLFKQTLFLLLALVALAAANPSEDYQIGTALTDVTGPVADEEMMGYAALGQVSHGLHMRLFIRTYILRHKQTGTSMVYVAMDLHSATSLRLQVVENLKLYHADLYALYNMDNIVLSPTHTHSGPGGFSWETLYSISSLGFDKHYFHAIVDAIVTSIVQAHKNLSQGGRILINTGSLFNSNINRSPTSYMLNPEQEQKEYEQQGNTDKTMTVLRFENENGKELGMMCWFAVHPVSLNNTNKLISSDNKGYAEYLFEKLKNGASSLPGTGPFLAAFNQANEGDSSCNTRGATCPDGKPCEQLHSTCGGKPTDCMGKGPVPEDDFASLKVIGTMQFEAALALYKNATRVVSGPIQVRHSFVPFTNYSVDASYTGNGKPGKTCQAALGNSFLAGTTDGVGWHFLQGENHTNPFWNFLGQFIIKPTEEQIACQYPKPILLDVGLAKPYPWVPSILPFQLFVIGKDVAIMAEPGEMTTMAGRRLKSLVKKTLMSHGAATQDTVMVIAGLANAYCQYVTTFEEFIAQRYEAASTLYGPHTHAAYLQIFDQLATAIALNQPVPAGPMPRNVSTDQINVNIPVILDTHPIGKPFGSILVDAHSSYTHGQNVQVEFVGGHPKNDYMLGKTFLTVERQSQTGWTVAFTDSDFATKMFWRRKLVTESVITIEWHIDSDVPSGTYRIRHFGNSRDLFGKVAPYSGTSASFTLQ